MRRLTFIAIVVVVALALLSAISAIIGNAIGPGVLHPANLNPERVDEAEQAFKPHGRNENRFHGARKRRGRTSRLESRSRITERRLGLAFSRRLRQSHRGPGPRRISPPPRIQRRDDGFARATAKRRRHGHLRLERTLRHRRDHRRTLRNRESPSPLRARASRWALRSRCNPPPSNRASPPSLPKTRSQIFARSAYDYAGLDVSPFSARRSFAPLRFSRCARWQRQAASIPTKSRRKKP